jgi:hypothetical protein
MKNTTGLRSRDIYTSTKDAYKRKYPNGKGIVITQSYLRLQSAILATLSSIEFGLLVNELAPNAQSVDPTEKRLSIVDNFLITEMRVSILKRPSGEAVANQAASLFPNPLIFSKVGEADAFQVVYNSDLNLQINGDTILDSWDVNRHYRVGTAQKGVNLNATGAAADKYQADAYESATNGFYPVTPQIEVRGNAKNRFRINLPVSSDLSGTSSDNFVILDLRGLLIQNGSTTAQR